MGFLLEILCEIGLITIGSRSSSFEITLLVRDQYCVCIISLKYCFSLIYLMFMVRGVRGKVKGYYVERKLFKFLSRFPGNFVFRVPVSGSRASRKYPTAFPDIFLVNNVEDRIVAFEVKSTSRKKVVVKRSQVSKLFRFLNAFKKYDRREAVIAVWFSRDKKWVFKKIEQILDENKIIVNISDKSNWNP